MLIEDLSIPRRGLYRGMHSECQDMPHEMKTKNSIKILVVDDQPAMCSILRSALEADGHEISEATNKEGLIECLETTPIDLVTLDPKIGGEDGLKLAREIRIGRNIPIVIITDKGAPLDRAMGLEQGADDYIVKPFHPQEVLIRVRNVIRRYAAKAASHAVHPAADSGERYGFDSGVLDVARRELRTAAGELIDLTDVEFDLLSIFLRQRAFLLSRDQLMLSLNGRDWTPENRTIDGHVARLRRKIDSQGEAPQLIKSVRCVGYVFTGDVQILHEPSE
jgi:two-component system OmpR family response regulator